MIQKCAQPLTYEMKALNLYRRWIIGGSPAHWKDPRLQTCFLPFGGLHLYPNKIWSMVIYGHASSCRFSSGLCQGGCICHTWVPSWGPRLSGHAPTPVPSKAAFPLGLSLTPHMFLCGPQSFKSSPTPAWSAHRSQYLLWHRAPPSKSALPAHLQQRPLPHASSISFPYTPDLFTFLLTCPLFVSSCAFSHTSPVSHFVWSHVHPAPVPTILF